MVFATSVVLAGDHLNAPDKAWWEVTPDPIRPARYEGIDRKSYYVTMVDAVNDDGASVLSGMRSRKP